MTSSDNAEKKGRAKNRMWAAIGGLVLAVSSYLVLYTINPNITRFNIVFPVLQEIQVPPPEEIPEINEVVYSRSIRSGPLPAYTGDIGSIDWTNSQQPISKYFTVGDATKGESSRRPRSEAEIRQIIAMAQELDKVREEWGGDIGITSWFRPPEVNASVGGVSGSQHINGIAVDIYPKNGELDKFQRWLLKNWSGGVGVYNSFVHIDMRSGGNLNGQLPGNDYSSLRKFRWDTNNGNTWAKMMGIEKP